MNVDQYLKRIGYLGDQSVSLNVLKQLQLNHLLTVPFENLDIHYGRPIKLSIPSLFEKIVENRRGGFCYELNGLFFELLSTLGFRCRRISARVKKKNGDYGPDQDHMAIMVFLHGTEYLVDVGFGEFSFTPIEMIDGKKHIDTRGDFVIGPFEQGYWHVSKWIENDWIPEYIFTHQSKSLNVFDKMCNYHQTSLDSSFTQRLFCTLPIPGGRITITKEKIKITTGDKIEELRVRDDFEFKNALKKYCGVAIDYN